MHLFVPKPNNAHETRTPLTPDTTRKLLQLGWQISAEADHGAKSGYADEAYEQLGVKIVEDQFAVLGDADIVIGVDMPTTDQIAAMKEESTYLGRLDPFNQPALIQALQEAKVTGISMEMLPRTTLAQKMDIVSSQANLAGYYAVILAAERLNKILPMMMTPAGTIAPAKVLVIGVGVAGLQAIATAKRLGARVQAFDTRPAAEEQVKSLGAKFVEVDLGDTGETEQGYARELTAEQLELQRRAMAKVCIESDVVITTARLFGRKAPVIVTGDIVERMRAGSIIVDLAAETGGNVEGTQTDEEIVTSNGVHILGYGKLETNVPAHASQVYAANVYAFIEHFWDKEAKRLNLDREDEIIAGCLLTQRGTLIHPSFRTKK